MNLEKQMTPVLEDPSPRNMRGETICDCDSLDSLADKSNLTAELFSK